MEASGTHSAFRRARRQDHRPAKLGKSLGGAAPFGYRWNDKRLVIDEKEAPIRRLLLELFLEHRRKRTVARLLNDAGHRTRNGSEFTATAIERLIVDPITKGTRRMNYRASPGKGSVFKRATDWVYVNAPALVPEDREDPVLILASAVVVDQACHPNDGERH